MDRNGPGLVLTVTVLYILSGILALDDLTASVFGDGEASKDVYPVAFTDYNGDKRTDLVVLTKNLSSFRIYLGSPSLPSLQYLPGFQCDIVVTSLKQKLNRLVRITGINLADFTGDGINDVLVSFKVNESDIIPPGDFTYVSIFKGGLNSLVCYQPMVLNATSVKDKTRLALIREPLIVDVNGDMIADLVGETGKNERKVWTFRHDLSPPREAIFDCDGGCLPIDTGGFVDIDGDFHPDLVLITSDSKNENPNDTSVRHRVEIYNTDTAKHGKFKLRQNITIDFPIGQMGNALFLDMNLNGRDHSILLPYCPDKKCKKSGFALVDVVSGVVHKLNVPFGDSGGNVWTFIEPSPNSNNYIQTISVRAGDFNLDGYPDLITTLTETKKSSSEADSRSVLFMNVPCHGSCDFPRTFEPNFYILDTYSNVQSTAFYDSNENGLLDIIGLRKTSKAGQNETFSIFVAQNSPEYDAYFVRWIITSGICDKNCPPYGVMLPGGTMKYTTMNPSSQTQSSRASQVFRTSFALDLPGNLMGIGASANFIDQITFGGSGTGPNYTRSQIIPNSNLIVIPWRKDGDEYRWEMKQILRPKGGGILATFHVLLFICFLNASLVFFLHMKERKMDRVERNRDPVSMSALTMT